MRKCDFMQGELPLSLFRSDSPAGGAGLLHGSFRRCIAGGLHHVIKDLAKFLQSRCWNDDGVAPPVDIFGYPQETASGILLERKDESLALDLNLVALQGVFSHRWFVP